MALGLGPQDVAVALCRALAITTLFTAFGTLLVRCCVAAAPIPPAGRRLRRLQWSMLGAACAAALLWCATETAAMAGTVGISATLATMPEVFVRTEFGHLQMLRLALLALAAMAAARSGGGAGSWAGTLAAILAGLAVALQAAMLHGYAMHQGISLFLMVEILHVLAAAAWLGSLPALAVLVAAGPPQGAAVAGRRFAVIGIAAVAALAVSAAVQARQLIGTWAGLFGTAYGRIAAAKLLLFAVLFGFAARNRLRFVPRAARGDGVAQERLRHSIALAAALGLIVLLLASLLGTMAPAIDMSAMG